jgi:hypothetical protein
MAISPDPTVPDVIYLDEQAIDDIFSYFGRGTVTEIVRRVSSEEEDSSELGFNKILVGRLGSRSIEGEETEFVRTLDPIGKLAMLREALTEEEMMIELGESPSESLRDELDRGNVVEMDTDLIQTPIEDVQDMANLTLDFHDAFGQFIDVDEEEVEDAKEAREMITALQREGDILRAKPPTGFDFVLTYDDENFRNPGLDFPRREADYTVLGQVTMKLEQGDSISLIDFVDMASRIVDNPHESRKKVLELKREFASIASTKSGRDVDMSEFEISHPDVEMKPIAIYR